LNRQATKLRFESTWQRLSHRTDGDAIGQALLDLYAGEARYYHTIDHIDFCLEVFDEVSDQCDNPDAVELAIWFHDAIYDFPVEENERLSAEYFMNVSQGRLPEDLRRVVFEQVMVTDHRRVPEDTDQKILTDIDLSSFGRPWERFISDGLNVRRELNYLEDDVFYQRQIAFMKNLLDREHFYATPWFQDNFEPTARQNLQQYLGTLAERGFCIV
jgi:predicted metal-dependent HD superfamily phosphohydrolase